MLPAGTLTMKEGVVMDNMMEELSSKTAFTMHILGHSIPIADSCVVTWIIMGAIVLLSIIFTHKLKKELDRVRLTEKLNSGAIERLDNAIRLAQGGLDEETAADEAAEEEKIDQQSEENSEDV